MNNYVTGTTIKSLREKQNLTQGQLAENIGVTDKAVSKWETGKGLPDISLIEPLANALNISVIELFAGEHVTNRNVSSNMKRSKVYVCPICGNVIRTTGEAVISCCGITLPVLEAEEPDSKHCLEVEKKDGQYYARMDHPMTKQHYISFMMYVSDGSVVFRKLYPESEAECWFNFKGHGYIYAYCSQHGMFKVRV